MQPEEYKERARQQHIAEIQRIERLVSERTHSPPCRRDSSAAQQLILETKMMGGYFFTIRSPATYCIFFCKHPLEREECRCCIFFLIFKNLEMHRTLFSISDLKSNLDVPTPGIESGISAEVCWSVALDLIIYIYIYIYICI